MASEADSEVAPVTAEEKSPISDISPKGPVIDVLHVRQLTTEPGRSRPLTGRAAEMMQTCPINDEITSTDGFGGIIGSGMREVKRGGHDIGRECPGGASARGQFAN